MNLNHNRQVAVIDLFAGSGGLSVGAELAGGDVRVSVEIDPICCDTLKANRRNDYHKIINQDVCQITGNDLRSLAEATNRDPLIIVGGPPCQPFSKAAYWTDPGEESKHRRARARGEVSDAPKSPLPPRDDQRRDLVLEFARLVTDVKATGFVFENVPSILHPRNQGIVGNLISYFQSYDYYVTTVVANAVEYGVPQLRKRVFLLGHQKKEPVPPEPTHYLEDNNQSNLLHCITAGEVLEEFDKDVYFESEEVVTGKWAAHLKEIPPGWNYKWHTAWAGHPHPTFETETRFWNFLLKLSPNKPSWTIAATPGPWTGPFHWSSRRLRTAEMAALQSFPKDYIFKGTRRERVRQIGNAVPPKLAAIIVRQVLSIEY